MNRIHITGTKNFFDMDKAELFKEGTYWDGKNHISKSTNSQWHHEYIYRTKTGKWVLNYFSNFQGEREKYSLISENDVANWFIKNEYRDDDIPDDILKIITDSNYEI